MARTVRHVLLCAVLAGLCAATPAAGQATDPALTVDQRFAPPDGVARDDLNTGTSTDIPAAVATDGARVYTIGETRDSAGNSDVGIVARRPDGTYDTAFSDDGKLILPLAAGTDKDSPSDLVVLPDGRLRVLASTDIDATAATDTATAVLGLNPDGSVDTTFGTNGVTRFKASAGTGPDAPTRMALGADGRIAVTGGATGAGGKEDTFLALLSPAGSLLTAFDGDGIRTFDRAPGGLNDRGVDIGFRPGGGLIALLRVETNPADAVNDYVAVLRAVDDAGADDARFNGTGDLQLAPGDPDTVAGGLLVSGDRLWVSGSTRTGLDTDAFVGRLNADGSGLETRRFDMRGDTILDDELVTSAASDLAMVPGPPETLIATGSINYSSRPYWAAAAFQNLGGPVGAWRLGDVIVPTAEYGALVGVTALGDGSLAVAGSLVDTQSNFDTSFGTARLLLDAKKTCDLAVEVVRPLEFAFPSGAQQAAEIKVSNAGDRPCAGRVTVSEPFALTGGATLTPLIDPGAAFTLPGLALQDRGARRVDDVATFTVAGQRDGNQANNTDPVRVRFEYCDLALRRVGAAPLMPSEGARVVRLSVRNGGTTPCAKVGVLVGGSGRAAAVFDRFALARGRSATVDTAARLRKRTKAGRFATVTFTAAATQQANPDNDVVSARMRVVSPPDSRIRAAGARAVRGSARAGSAGRKAPKKARRAVRLRGVQVAVQRRGKHCATLAGRSGRLRAAKGRRCGARTWIDASGARRWKLRLARRLPAGRYVVYSRATARDRGLPEAAWSKADRNTTTFRVR